MQPVITFQVEFVQEISVLSAISGMLQAVAATAKRQDVVVVHFVVTHRVVMFAPFEWLGASGNQAGPSPR